jgi:RNA polymerase sigma factor (sigma-70 family)
MEKEEQRELLNDIIEKSPEMYKAVIVMRYFENMGYNEIGKHYNVTREMARMYCKKALKYIEEKLKKE